MKLLFSEPYLPAQLGITAIGKGPKPIAVNIANDVASRLLGVIVEEVG